MTKRILLIVSGGVAAYKAIDIARFFLKHHISVTPILTKNAKEFVTELSFEVLCGEKVYSHLFEALDKSEIGHIELARSADLILVCPASANIIARMAHGIADDLATTILLATTSPIFIAPAMNVRMWEHAATQSNMEILRKRNIHIIEPTEGEMACGEYGIGRLADIEDITSDILSFLENDSLKYQKDLKGKKILVTAGPTREAIDPVRYISNYSSGLQGYAIAEVLGARGASVTLISGPVTLQVPKNVTVIDVVTASEMLEGCMNIIKEQDVAICVAAVCDWRPIYHQEKMKKENTAISTLNFLENPDILAQISAHPMRPKLVIGFAAETENIIDNAIKKKKRKQCDWLLANNVSKEKTGHDVFGAENNKIIFFDRDAYEIWDNMEKKAVARKLADKISIFFKERI